MNHPAPANPLLATLRRLFLTGLVREVRIGIHDFERAKPQRIVFDIDLYVSLAATTPQRDDIAEVVDYDYVRQVVFAITDASHIDLQETLCDRVLEGLLAHPQVLACQVSTRKPDVYPDCAAVGVEAFKSKAPLEREG
ncbi:MAG: dihydroneopterin aldolase [Burkholderiaceae bacterium]